MPLIIRKSVRWSINSLIWRYNVWTFDDVVLINVENEFFLLLSFEEESLRFNLNSIYVEDWLPTNIFSFVSDWYLFIQ